MSAPLDFRVLEKPLYLLMPPRDEAAINTAIDTAFGTAPGTASDAGETGG